MKTDSVQLFFSVFDNGKAAVPPHENVIYGKTVLKFEGKHRKTIVMNTNYIKKI